MRIAVIDGQGGGIGKALVEKIRQEMGDGIHVLGLGTNALAASIMMKAGANRGATGENAIVRATLYADIIVGPLAIIMPNSMMGEVTTPMAEAVSSCGARKVLIRIA